MIGNIDYWIPEKLRGKKIKELNITVPKDSIALVITGIGRDEEDSETLLCFLDRDGNECGQTIYPNSSESFNIEATQYFLDARYFDQKVVLNGSPKR